jgi:chromosomal replication initiator protein
MKKQFTLDDSDDHIRLDAAWEQVLRRLLPEVPAAWYAKFLSVLKPVELKGDIAVLRAPGAFVHEWVTAKYVPTLQNYLSDEFGYEIKIQLLSEPRERQAVRPAAEAVPVPRLQATDDDEPAFAPFEKFTFDNFIEGSSNRLALAGAKAVASFPGLKYNPLFIYGGSGLGKTHLLHSIARELMNSNPGLNVKYMTAQRFVEGFVGAMQANRIEQFRKKQRSVGVWLLDDVQFIMGKDKTQEEIFHTFNYLNSLGKQIVLCADRPPKDLYQTDERLRSRFEAGLVADIQYPDTETRCAIIQSKAEADAVPLEPGVAFTLAQCVPGNIRVLEGALTKMAVMASLEGVPISQDFALSMVERYYKSGVIAKPSLEAVLSVVSRHFKIGVEDIRGQSRKAPIVEARHVAVYLLRETTHDSWKHIGTLLGNRDHTSMMHGYHRVNERMTHDTDYRAAVESLKRNVFPQA